ncbi:MAG: co-chaperone GroES [Ignavibacteriota bacterium]|jgi:co-chaperonin GroES (HSP10)|nr:MAG: co-chaperone GroES [Ignavibacterium sp.]MBL1155262.1 co-chaperone GroES [Ignavibacteriota bacterium]MCO6447742.1 co-chaperone GroES [Ignavibacterium album]MCZ2269076.1 co-chaperone GroES family protein [Ignavibacteriales bacterium]MDX9711331.1 co-chaperone GroES family protein [Ignavibacteriaceae bacterium]
MSLNFKNLQKFIVVGDRVLIRPQEDSNKTSSGLYLPAGVAEKERIQSGYVIKVGPGYATSAQNEDEPWKQNEEQVKYIPLQAKEGDLAIFLRKEAFEIEFEKEKLLIVPNPAILLLIRNDDFLV